MRKWGAGLVSLVVAIAVAQPAFREPPRDSYPLSNYPMFADELGTVNNANTVLGITAAGDRRTLSPQRIAGSDEVMHAAGHVYNELVSGNADRLCREVAARVASGGPRDLVEVEVVTQRQDAVAYFQGDRRAEGTVHARCVVGQ